MLLFIAILFLKGLLSDAGVPDLEPVFVGLTVVGEYNVRIVADVGVIPPGVTTGIGN